MRFDSAPARVHQQDKIRIGRQLEAADRHYAQRLLDTNPAILAAGLDEQYELRDHLRAIGRAYRWLADTPDARLLVQTPPQVGKTTTAVEWGIFHWLATHPRDRIVVGSYNRELAARAGGHIRELIIRHGHLFDIELNPADRSRQDFSLRSGAGVRSVGIGSGLTGHPAHLALIDDPHKDRQEAESVRIRDSIWDWYSSVLLSRFQPGTRLVLVLTRWHQDDLAGRLLDHDGRTEEGGSWRVLHMPAIADPALTPHGDPLGRRAGEPLPRPRIPEGDTSALRRFWSNRRKETPSPRDWASLYQGDPRPPEGALVTAEVLRGIRVFDRGQHAAAKRIAVAVDPGGGGRDTVGIVAGYLGVDDRLWITHDATDVLPVRTWPRVVAQLAHDTNADLILYEHNYGGAMPGELIRQAWDALQHDGSIPAGTLPPLLQDVRAKQGKRLRAEPVAQAMNEDRVRTAAYMPDLETEWCTWMPTDPDSPGRVDAVTYLGRELLPGPVLDTGWMAPDEVDLDQVMAAPSWADIPIVDDLTDVGLSDTW